MNGPQKNSVDSDQIREAENRAKRIRKRELDDVRSVLATPEGRRFVWKYLVACGVFQSSFTGNSTTFFKEGERNIGLKILADINDASPEAYVVMQRESKGDQNV